MNKIKTLTVNGESYQLWDKEAAHIDDSNIGLDAWSSKNTVDKLCPGFTESGAMVTCEPVGGCPLTVQAEESATAITRTGKNLFNELAFYEANGFEQQADGSWYGYSPTSYEPTVTVFENTTGIPGQFTFSAETLSPNNTNACLIYWEYTDGTDGYGGITGYDTMKYKTATSNASKTVKRVKIIYQTRGYYYIKNAQLEYGAAATAYAPYKAPETFAPGETVPALEGVNTLWADSGEITVTGKADPTAVIEKLTNAIIALGGNI